MERRNFLKGAAGLTGAALLSPSLAFGQVEHRHLARNPTRWSAEEIFRYWGEQPDDIQQVFKAAYKFLEQRKSASFCRTVSGSCIQ